MNSITIDIDQINKDKNIMEINCSNLDDKIINLNFGWIINDKAYIHQNSHAFYY